MLTPVCEWPSFYYSPCWIFGPQLLHTPGGWIFLNKILLAPQARTFLFIREKYSLAPQVVKLAMHVMRIIGIFCCILSAKPCLLAPALLLRGLATRACAHCPRSVCKAAWPPCVHHNIINNYTTKKQNKKCLTELQCFAWAGMSW